MINFKQYHDENMMFYRETKLYFGQCDIKQNISLCELLLLTSDTAVEDYHQRGLTFDFLCEHNTAILVSRSAFRFHRMPKCNDLLTIKTWEQAPKGLQLSRCYEISNDKGEKLVSGSSAWIVVDTNTRKIMRPQSFTLREAPSFSLEMDCMDCGRIAVPENMQKLDERIIHNSDIDANGHMNNSRYASFIYDVLPKEYQDREMSDFRINYSHEITSGGVLSIFGSFLDDKAVIVGKNGDEVCFESDMMFKPLA